MARAAKPTPPPQLMDRVRAIALALPHAEESKSYGNPAFKVSGRPFVVLDHYKGQACVWMLCPADHRTAALARSGWFASPYDKAGAAVCMAADAVEQAPLGDAIKDSYGLAASAG